MSHGRYVRFLLAAVAVSQQMFKDILMLIARLRAPPHQREGRWDQNASDCKAEVRLEEDKAASSSAAAPATIASAPGGTHRGWSLSPSTTG